MFAEEVEENPPEEVDEVARPFSIENMSNVSASERKLLARLDDMDNTSSSEEDADFISPSGYRFTDMPLLSNIVDLLICPKSKSKSVQWLEKKDGKIGFASDFVIQCSGGLCTFQQRFYSSKKIGKAFEVSQRSVLGAKNIRELKIRLSR